jgi:hypothetical protein
MDLVTQYDSVQARLVPLRELQSPKGDAHLHLRQVQVSRSATEEVGWVGLSIVPGIKITPREPEYLNNQERRELNET